MSSTSSRELITAALALISEDLRNTPSAPQSALDAIATLRTLYALTDEDLARAPTITIASRAATPSASGDADNEAKFQQYVARLKKMNYFKGAEEGTPEYAKLIEKARGHFAARTKKDTESAPGADAYADLSPEERRKRADQQKDTGNELLRDGKFQEALQSYSEAIALDGSVALYWSNRAVAYQKLGRHADAAEDLRKAINVDPAYSKSYGRLVTSLIQLREFDEAIKVADQAEVRGLADATIKRLKSQAIASLPRQAGGGGFGDDDSGMNEGAMPSFGGPGGMPNMPQFPTGPNGAMPSFAEMMSNPEYLRMAQDMVMNNPQLMQAAQQMMQDPNMMQMFQNMMGGMGGAGGAFPGAGAPGGGFPFPPPGGAGPGAEEGRQPDL